MTTLSRFDQMLNDFYAQPGARLKQYVVDMRREADWVRDTCPVVGVGPHRDNIGAPCRNDLEATWDDLECHDCCCECNDMAGHTRMRPDVLAWIAERDARPPICADHSLLSDEVQEPYGMAENPILKLARKPDAR